MLDTMGERSDLDEELVAKYGADTVAAAHEYFAYLQNLQNGSGQLQPAGMSSESIYLARLMWLRAKVQNKPAMLQEAEKKLNNPHSLCVAELYVKRLIEDIQGIEGIIHDEDWQQRFGEAQACIIGTDRTIEEWKFCCATIPEQTRQRVREVEDALSWMQPEDESA